MLGQKDISWKHTRGPEVVVKRLLNVLCIPSLPSLSRRLHRDTSIHIYIQIVYNNNLSCRSRLPETPGMKFLTHIVSNYQSLTIVTKTHISGITLEVDPTLHIIGLLPQLVIICITYISFIRYWIRLVLFFSTTVY